MSGVYNVYFVVTDTEERGIKKKKESRGKEWYDRLAK